MLITPDEWKVLTYLKDKVAMGHSPFENDFCYNVLRRMINASDVDTHLKRT